jgi:hypothetical protein
MMMEYFRKINNLTWQFFIVEYVRIIFVMFSMLC